MSRFPLPSLSSPRLLLGALLFPWLFAAAAPAQEAEAVFKADQGSPERQGWRRFAEETSTHEGLEDGEAPAWRIGGQGTTVNRILYVHPLPQGALAQEPWQVQATVRVSAASGISPADTVLEVRDGVSQWALCLIRAEGQEGIGHLTAEGTLRFLGSADLAGYGVLTARYRPETSTLEVAFDDAVIGTLSRVDVPPAQANQRRVAWGDNNAAVPEDNVRAESYWREVRFTLGAP